MRHVSFTTNLFENKEPPPHFINPICFGEDLTAWLIEKIRLTVPEISAAIQEDYGWGFWATIDGATYWTAIAINEETIGQAVAEWYITIAYEPGCNPIRRWFKRPRPEALLALRNALDTALHSEPAITDIRWWSTDFDSGQPSAHPT